MSPRGAMSRVPVGVELVNHSARLMKDGTIISPAIPEAKPKPPKGPAGTIMVKHPRVAVSVPIQVEFLANRSWKVVEQDDLLPEEFFGEDERREHQRLRGEVRGKGRWRGASAGTEGSRPHPSPSCPRDRGDAAIHLQR